MANKKRTDNKGRKLPEGFSQREDGRYQARWTFLGKRYCLYGWDLKQLKDDVIQRKAQQKSTMNIMEPSKITLAENGLRSTRLAKSKNPHLTTPTRFMKAM